MAEARTLKGHLMSAAASAAVSGPWRGTVERAIQGLGHRFPNNRVVISSCRHFGTHLIRREGQAFTRLVTFDSGGQMLCGGEDSLALASTMYYFLGTITSQDEDERPVLNLFRKALRPGDTLFDIGANIGFYSFYLGPICGKSGVVHSFEANPLLVPHLRRSAELNQPRANIVVNAVAIGKEGNRTLQLYDPERIGGSSVYQLAWLDTGKSVTVPMTTIDDYRRANGINRIDVVKIDIEGSELDAFRGMEETFAVCPPKLIVCELALFIEPVGESSGPQTGAASRGLYAIQIIEFLRSKGYQPHYIDQDDGRVGAVVEPHAIVELQQNLINVAFVHDGLRQTRPDLFRA